MNASPANLKNSCGHPEIMKPTILLVEDETDVREVTRAVLEQAGYRVLESNGPEDALRLGSDHCGRIDLLLSDVVMPGMNGRELALRLHSLRPGLITIFMSGYADHDALRTVVHGAGATFIPKPFTIDVLLAGVAEALRPSQPRAGEAASQAVLAAR
jgi:two-component system, cell cycle sensor histidine kinase and response regulator CckA